MMEGISDSRRTRASLGPRQSPFQCLMPMGTVWPPLTTAPPEGRAARSAKRTLGRAQISWTGWLGRVRRPALLWLGTGCAVGRAHPGHPPALAPRRSCRGLHRAWKLQESPPGPHVLPQEGPRGGVAHLSSETPHVGRLGWGAEAEGRKGRGGEGGWSESGEDRGGEEEGGEKGALESRAARERRAEGRIKRDIQRGTGKERQVNRAGKRRARETEERRCGSEERAADKRGDKTERRTGERFEDVEG